MIVFKKIQAIRSYLDDLTNKGLTIGFAPTMGALHKGHISLIQASKENCDISVCSIFINPTQFNQKSDLDKYPMTLVDDLNILLENETDVVFIPDASEIYPNSMDYEMPYDLDNLDTILEGAKRPGHFKGVIQVVDRLLEIIKPNKLFMGQKDFQQFSIINKMLLEKGGNVELIVCPIIREEDGLAMSSRNVRLSKKDRNDALQLHKALRYIKNNLSSKSVEFLVQESKTFFDKPNIKLEYLVVANPSTLKSVRSYESGKGYVALVSAWVGDVRLIDNMILDDK